MGLPDREALNWYAVYGRSKWVYMIGKLQMGLLDVPAIPSYFFHDIS